MSVFFFEIQAGQEKFNFLLQSYFASVSGAIIVYDITNISSFHAVRGG